MPRSTALFVFFGLFLCVDLSSADGILFPQESEKRQLNTLDGIWNFRAANRSNQEEGFNEQWYLKPLKKSGPTISMPVPSSYNDITQDAALRDHLGWVWYDREFFIPISWSQENIFVRFGSATYHAIVWINGLQVVEHAGGFLPFQADITSKLLYGDRNRITVALNNTLSDSTLPQGRIRFFTNPDKYPPGYNVLAYDFDWFNFAGIHRPVYLYTVPKTAYVDDINITTTLSNNNDLGMVSYAVGIKGANTALVSIDVNLFDQDGNKVTSRTGQSGLLSVSSPSLWWPRGMNDQVGYLYTIQVQLKDQSTGFLVDSYRLRIGIRDIDWDNDGVYINRRRVYFKGFGRHEDSLLRGRGLDHVTLIKDFNLMQWTGANSFRTSHYPYSEELMDLADEQGFMIINEVPACTMRSYGNLMRENHKQTLKELVNRDKNRPSVVMWSVGNEPDSTDPLSQSYFSDIAQYTRTLDGYRPITLVLSFSVVSDLVGQFFDVICINRYYAWYDDVPGALEIIASQMIYEVTRWREKYNKPVMVTEYGADTVAGFHQDPSWVWTEDFQVDLMTENFNAFDDLYFKGYLIGEMIWNFADFATQQDIKRAIVNRKGVFTRDRQPKASARHLKKRYTTLIR